MKSTITILAAGVALIIVAIYGSVETSHADAPIPSERHLTPARPPLPRWMTTPCPTEDSWNCYWHATNPTGRSFFVRRMPHTDRLCYLYARHSDPRTDQCIRRARGL